MISESMRRFPDNDLFRPPKTHDSERLKRDIDAFIQNGGKIQHIPSGLSMDMAERFDMYNRK